MLNDDTYETSTMQPAASENRNPLTMPNEGEAIYQQLEDGSWVGIHSLHVSHQFHAKGATKEICQQKIHDYIEGV